MLKNIGFFGYFIDRVVKSTNSPPPKPSFSRFLHTTSTASPSFLIGYYGFWDGIDYFVLQDKEEQCGYLAAAYEINTGKYVIHRVFSSLGMCVMP